MYHFAVQLHFILQATLPDLAGYLIVTGILLPDYLYRYPVPYLSRLPEKTSFFCFPMLYGAGIVSNPAIACKKGCATTHCELGLSGCLQVWRGCWGNDLCLLEHLTLTKQAQNKLAAAQTKMERSIMLNITNKDRKTNIWVSERTKVRYNQQCDTNEMVPGMAHQPPQKRQMDLECHHLETI